MSKKDNTGTPEPVVVDAQAVLTEEQIQAEREERLKALMKRYREGDIWLSPSSLKAFAKSPRHFIQYKMADFIPSDAMKIGTVMHTHALGTASDMVIFDPADRPDQKHGMTAKANKAWKADFYASNDENKIISREGFDKGVEMAEALSKNPFTRQLLDSPGMVEQRLEWEYGDVMFSGFTDKIVDAVPGSSPGQIVDLKKVADATPSKLRWVIRDMAYDMAMAMYNDGLGGDHELILVFIDTNCHIAVVELLGETVRQAEARYKELTHKFKACVEHGLFMSSYEYYTENGFYYV